MYARDMLFFVGERRGRRRCSWSAGRQLLFDDPFPGCAGGKFSRSVASGQVTQAGVSNQVTQLWRFATCKSAFSFDAVGLNDSKFQNSTLRFLIKNIRWLYAGRHNRAVPTGSVPLSLECWWLYIWRFSFWPTHLALGWHFSVLSEKWMKMHGKLLKGWTLREISDLHFFFLPFFSLLSVLRMLLFLFYPLHFSSFSTCCFMMFGSLFFHFSVQVEKLFKEAMENKHYWSGRHVCITAVYWAENCQQQFLNLAYKRVCSQARWVLCSSSNPRCPWWFCRMEWN